MIDNAVATLTQLEPDSAELREKVDALAAALVRAAGRKDHLAAAARDVVASLIMREVASARRERRRAPPEASPRRAPHDV
jgi:hypothetical protein